MADATINVVDGRAVVTVFGAELLGPLVAAAAEAAASAEADADSAAADAAAAADSAADAVAAAAVAVPAAASATAGAATATAAAATATAAAAIVEAAGGERLFGTLAEMTTALATGQWGWRLQAWGLGADAFQELAGVAVYQGRSIPVGATGDLILRSRSLEGLTLIARQMPVTPLFRHIASDGVFSNGRCIPNRQATTPPTVSWVMNPSGSVPSAVAGPTITNNYGPGPTAVAGESQRLLFTTTSQTFRVFTQQPLPNTIPYKARFFVKAVSGTGPWNIRHGHTATQLVTVNGITDAAWVEVTFSRTPATALENYIISGTGANLPDIEVAHIQVIEDRGLAFPAYAAELAASPIAYHLTAGLSYTGSLALSDKKLVTTGGVLFTAGARVRWPSYPATTNVADIGCFILQECYSLPANPGYYLNHPSSTLFRLGITTSGGLGTLPALGEVENRIRLPGQGARNIGMILRSNYRGVFYEGVEMYFDAIAVSPIATAYLQVGGSSLIAGLPGAIIDQAVFVDQGTNLNAKAGAIVQAQRDRAALVGIDVTTDKYILAGVGDSNTASMLPASTGGDGYLIQQGNAGVHSPNLAVRNFGRSGTGIPNWVGELATFHYRFIASALRAGKIPIYSVMPSFANARPEYAADPTAYLNSFWAFTDALRNYRLPEDPTGPGCKLVVCTPLPSQLLPSPGVASTAQEAGRQTVMTMMRAATSKYDALADIGGDPIVGNPASYGTGMTNAYDPIHLTQAGHDIARPILTAALQSVML